MRPGPALLLLGLGLGLGLGPGRLPATPPPRVLPTEPPARVPLWGEVASPRRPVGAQVPRAPPPSARSGPLRAPRAPPHHRLGVLHSVQGSTAGRGSPAHQVLTPCRIQNLKITSDRGASPLVLNRKQNATLDAQVRVDCPQAQGRLEGWQVLPLRSVGDPHRWQQSLKLHQLHLVTGRERWVLLVPSNFLAPGLYAFNYSLSLLSRGLEFVNSSDCFYITFVRSPLRAVLDGPQLLTMQFTDQLVLNGSASSDPDANNYPFAGIQFAWFCTTNPDLLRGHRTIKPRNTKNHLCLPEQESLLWPDPQGPVLTLPPTTLRGGSTYFFRMVIQKAKRRGFADKTVQVELGPRTPTSITCLENCGPELVVSDTFSLFVNCTRCSPRDVYRWSFVSATGKKLLFDWKARSSSGRNQAYLSLQPFALEGVPEASYEMRVRLATWGGRNVSLGHTFVVNQPPQGGECRVHPEEGTTLLTDFVIQCLGFRDKDTPLKYKIIVSDLHGLGTISSLRENTLGAILYLGYQSRVPTSFLPPGDAADRDSLKLYAQVSDSRGAFSQVSFQATVHAPTNVISSQTLLKHLGNLTAAPHRSVGWASTVSKQDTEVAGYLLYLVASMLSKLKPTEDQKSQRQQLYEDLIEQAIILPLDTVEEISQVVMLITKLTENAEDLPRLIQIQALVRIWQASQALREHREKARVTTEQVEAVCTGILSSLSNLLRYFNPYEVTEEPLYVLQGLVETILDGMVPGNGTTALRSSGINIYMRKTRKWNVSSVCEEDLSGLACFQPTLTESSIQSLPDNSPVSVTFYTFATDPFPWLARPMQSSVRVVGFRVTGRAGDGEPVDIVPNMTDMLLLRTNLTVGLFPLTMGPENKMEAEGEPGRATSGVFSFQVGSSAQEVLVYILTEVTVLFTASLYAGSEVSAEALVVTFLVPPDSPPVANESDRFDSACSVKSARVLCLSLSLLQLLAKESPEPEPWVTVELQAPRFVTSLTDRLVNISVIRLQCLDMHEDYGEWREHTCVLGPRTTWAQVHCVCSILPGRARRQLDALKVAAPQLKIHFLSSRVLVAPNFVDLRLEVIKTIPQNPVTLLTVISIMLLYVALAFWALHRDETDQYLRDNVIVLPDNDPYDNVCYLVTVFTGSRCGAGTRADVFVELRGTEGASDVHCLSHPQVKALYRGSVNTFLLTTKSDLGDLQAIRVWHNNEGRAPGWYLSRIRVESLFSRHIWLFMCRQWLSVDTSLDHTFHPVPPDAHLDRKDYFLIDCVHSLGKDHPWFSIFSGVVANDFNRLQRLSCCLAMLLSSLVCNIMFFNLHPDDPDEPVDLKYAQSMAIGLESSLITLPVQLVITALFTYSQRRPQATLEEVAPQTPPVLAKESGHWEQRLEAWYNQEANKAQEKSQGKKSHVHKAPVKARPKKGPVQFQTTPAQQPAPPSGPQAPPPSGPQAPPPSAPQAPPPSGSQAPPPSGSQANRNISNANAPESSQHPPGAESVHPDPEAPQKPQVVVGSVPLDAGPPEKKPQLTLPRWCVFVAWFLVFATSSISSSFIIFYGLTYGYDKSVEWLFASFCSFCQSVFLVQPLKITLATGYRTNQPKYCKNLPWTSNYQYTEIKLRGQSLSPEETAALHQDIAALRRSRMYQPLTEDEIRIFQRKKRVRKRALLFLGYVVTHVTFLALLLILVAQLCHAESFYYNRFIRDRLSVDLGSVTRLEDVYQWLGRVAVPLFHNQQLPTFLPDSSSKILGLPRMRQVRAEPSQKLCLPAEKVVPGRNNGRIHCHPEYGVDREDTKNYSGAWNDVNAQKAEGFQYKGPEEDGDYASVGLLHAYGSGGYTVYFYPEEQQFNSTLSLAALQKAQWLDERTWAVILELTTYNPDAGLFCSVSVMFEVSQLGVVNSSLALHSFTLADLAHETSAEVYLYAAIFIFFVAYMLDEAYVMGQEQAAYVRSVYNWLNLALKCVFAAGVVLFWWKHLQAAHLLRSSLARPAVFVLSHAVAQLDQAMRVLLGFLIFLTVLKSLRYSRVFYNVRLAQRAIQTAATAIGHMALIVSVYFFVYMIFSYLVFGQHEWRYSSLTRAALTILSYCASAFQSTELLGHRALGLLFLCSFLLVMICVLINLLRAVILSAYEGMKQAVYEQPSDEAEAVSYLCGKLRAALAFVLCQQPESQDELQSKFLVDMVYGQPLKKIHYSLGLKTRNINGKKMVYLVV